MEHTMQVSIQMPPGKTGSWTSESTSPEDLDTILQDESLAPLKRNHACLTCKRRKTRCCGTRPVCSPCLRSHAHALRSANKNNTAPPVLCCDWADDGDESDRPVHSDDIKKRLDVKKTKGSLAGKALEREKEKRRDEEKETLLARIAELEARLSDLQPSGKFSQSKSASINLSTNVTPESVRPMHPLRVEDYAFSQPPNPVSSSGFGENETTKFSPASAPDPSNNGIDLSGLFMVPLNWPAGLPSPFLLDHLIETFFTQAPQIPRLVHKVTLLSRIKLPPTHSNFPHPSLLHAICAHAAPYTAWVNNFPPNTLEADVERHKRLYGTMDNVEDFGLAQAELAQKAVRLSSQFCMTGGPLIFEMCQATVILTDFYFQKGMPLQGWMMSASGPHLLKALEFMNKNPREFYNEDAMAEEPKDWIQREERLATVWMSFILDASYTLNSYWNGSLDLEEIFCQLPISAEKFKSMDTSMASNPQSAHSKDFLIYHPVADSFVLSVKAATLVNRSAKWVRRWLQRDRVPGDELTGMRSPAFVAIVNDIYAFHVNSTLKNLFRTGDSVSSTPLDADLILVHVLPNLALCMLHESFADWRGVQEDYALSQVQKGFEGVLGILHIIPSNLDMSLIMNSPLLLCLFTCGRLISNVMQRSVSNQQYGLVLRYRADLQTVQNILLRYGQKHAVGVMMSTVLTAYLEAIEKGKPTDRQLCLGYKGEDDRGEDGQFPFASQYFAPPNPFGSEDRFPPRPSTYQLDAKFGASSESSGYTPPGASASTGPSRSGSSGAPTPNDMLDFTHHVEYIDASGAVAFLPPGNGLQTTTDSHYSSKEFVTEGKKAQISAPDFASFAVNVDGKNIVWAGM